MEDTSSLNDAGVLATLRALAARGTTMRRDTDGGGLIVRRKGKSSTRMTPQEFLQMLDAGLLTELGAGEYVLSRRGMSHLRRQLNLQAGQAGKTAAVTRAGTEPGQPRPEPVSRPTINPAESPLAWLRKRRDAKTKRPLISATQFEAGERLRADFELAQLTPRVTASWNLAAPGNRPQRGVPGVGLEIPEIVAAAHQRVAAAMRAVGPDLSGVLVDVCCLLNGLEAVERKAGWPRRGGKLMLQTALTSLARHYGLEPPVPPSGPAFIWHWGAPGYRPTIGSGPGNGGDDGTGERD